MVKTLLRRVIALVASVAVGAVEAVLWCIHAVRRLLPIAADAVSAYRRTRGGVLRCPRGHAVQTEGVFACRGCGFTYLGSAWRCPNPECPAPVASFCDCPTCGLSVRNPYRWGSP